MKNVKIIAGLHHLLLALLIGSLLFCACGGEVATKEAPAKEATTEEPVPVPVEKPEPANEAPQPAPMADLKTNEKVYAWVNNLNIRNKGSLKGKTLTSVVEEEALEFTGIKSDKVEIIVLRGVAYEEPWLDVKTKDGTEGWVFGGAVKRKGESKGNAPISDESFFYPHFGRFDLKDWKKVSSESGGGGDAESETTVYSKNSRTLEITKTDVGEYGYHREYKLKDGDGKVLKTRNFSFNTDYGKCDLSETVNVYTFDPPTKYTRSQSIKSYWSDLNDDPVMVNGAWVEGPADKAPTASPKAAAPSKRTNSSSSTTTKGNSGGSTGHSIGEAPANCSASHEEGECAVQFQEGNMIVFRSDGEDGCLTINGVTVNVEWEDVSSERRILEDQSEEDNWIILNEKGDNYIFGEKFEIATKYEEHRAELVRTLLVMDEIPSTIPYQSNGTVGMGMRGEVRSMIEEAIQMAKADKKKGKNGPPDEARFSNDQFIVHFTITPTKKDETGEHYKGTMELFSKDGKKLSSKNVTGLVNC